MRRRMMMMQEKDEPVFVDYIQCDGAESYIRITDDFSGISSFTIDFQRASIFGAHGATQQNTNGRVISTYLDSQTSFYIYNGINAFSNRDVTISDADFQRHICRLNLDGNYQFDDYSGKLNGVSGLSPNFPCTVGAVYHYRSNVPIQYSYLEYYNNDKIYDVYVDDARLRPCYYKGEYGLWDTANNEFHGNSGTGTITGGYDNE